MHLLLLVTVFLLFDSLSIESKQSMAWYNYLPDCPCQNPDRRFVNIKDGWAKDRGDINKYHKGASSCFRSYPPIKTSEGESGQQCCYDKSSNLIPQGSGAGTPDKVSTCNGENSEGIMITKFTALFNHYRKDVKPWNDFGGQNGGWMKYNLLWKPNKGQNCQSSAIDR